jgi:pilus assembly protein CpaB
MSARSLIMITLALVFGGSAAVGVNQLVQKPPGPKLDTVDVLVAAMDLPRGGNITSELVKVRALPREAVPVGALTKPEDAENRAVSIPLMKDEPVLEAKLAPKGAGRGMAALVPTGMRAYTIQTPNVAQGVAGFILPGNKVDVLLSVSEGLAFGPNQTVSGTTTMLLQNVEILAVDQKIDAPAENKVSDKDLRSVTLLVTPQQANYLTLGQQKGQLYLALRNLKDDQTAQTRPATLGELRFHQEPAWDERAKGVLEALGKALSQIKIEPRPVAQARPAPPVDPPRIRTLRGSNEGVILIQPPESSRVPKQSPTALGARN